MKVLIVHLSDIHLRTNSDLPFAKKAKLVEAIQNSCLEAQMLFLVVTGDVAYGGTADEYYAAIEFIDGIKEAIERYTQKKFHIVLVPGNHDCNLISFPDLSVRNALIKSIISDPETVDERMIEKCCETQVAWCEFSEYYKDPATKLLFSDKLLCVIEYKIDKFSVIFCCYNTAWMSQLQEQPNSIIFPYANYKGVFADLKADLLISVLHHPFDWQNKNVQRGFKEHIEITSDIVITGHEHVATKSGKDDFEGNYNLFVEGAILHNPENKEDSGFNLIFLDLEKEVEQVQIYQWHKDYYSNGGKAEEWHPYKRGTFRIKGKFRVNEEFNKFLTDPGAAFSHRNKENIFLDDIFVFPNLKDLKKEKDEQRDLLGMLVEASNLTKLIDGKNRYVITGGEKAGKTTLCKVLFKCFFRQGSVPVFIEGHKISSSSYDGFSRVLNKCFQEQYGDDSLESFMQLSNDSKILIMDDFHNCRLNLEHKAILIKAISEKFSNVLITANDLFIIEEMIYREDQKAPILSDFRRFEIMEFGHLLRSKLIDTWNTLGQESYIEEDDLIRRNDEAKRTIDSVIGKNFVPSYPIFILTLLQSIEAGTPHDFKESAFGHYYGYLITRALGKLKISHDALDTYVNYLTEMANLFFKRNRQEVHVVDLREFHLWFCKEYITLDMERTIRDLVEASMLYKQGDSIRFRYKYVYYFFVAKYLANNLSQDEVKATVSELCKKMYHEEFANIVIFLTHHSKDPFILSEILHNAKTHFAELAPVQFADDIAVVNTLIKEMPKLVLEDKDVRKARETVLKSRDAAELSAKHVEVNTPAEQPHKDISELDVIARLNLAFKTVEIIGQILKNYSGSLRQTQKLELGEEAYFIGLRSINLFFSLLRDNVDGLIAELMQIISTDKRITADKVDGAARKLLFHFGEIVSFGFIKKVSNSVGSEKLYETYAEILKKHNSAAVRLVDMSIKLDFYAAFPFEEMRVLKEELSSNILPLTVLKRLVIRHLYMFKTDYKDKQRICNILGIPMSAQRVISIAPAKRR